METHGQLSPGPSSHLLEITEEPNYQAITEQKQQPPSSQHHQPSYHRPLSPRQSQQTMPPDSSAIIYQVWLSQCKAQLHDVYIYYTHVVIYIQRKIFLRRSIFLYSSCPNLEGIKDALSYKFRRLMIGQNCCAVCTNKVARA